MNFWNFDLIPRNIGLMGASWEITKYIQKKVLKVVKLVIQNSNFIFLTYDEVTTMDNTSWANVHGYIVYD